MKTNIEKILRKEGYLLYTTKGTSMYPLLKEGLIVRLEVSDKYNRFDIVLFKRRKNTYVLHRIIDIRDDIYIVIGDNASHIDYLKKEDILAKLTGICSGCLTFKIEEIDKNPIFNDSALIKSLIKNPEAFFLIEKRKLIMS